jgi:large subunit ribosomal protein L2
MLIIKEQKLTFSSKKKLSQGKKLEHAGRNHTGSITLKHRGGGHKRNLRIVDLKKVLWNMYGIILKFVYDSNRTAPLVLICFLNGILSYQIASQGLKIGSFIFIGNLKHKKKLTFDKGDTSVIKDMQDGTFVNSIELNFMKGGSLVRAAGTTAQLLKVAYTSNNYSLFRLPSKEERLIFANSIATIGQIANLDHFLLIKSKASINRFLGKKPIVRGVAMNPIDHPHGGGQGKTSGAGGFRSQVTFNGKVAKGQPTRSRNKKTTFIIFSRKKKYFKHNFLS